MPRLENSKRRFCGCCTCLTFLQVWLTADSAEPAARSAYVDPDSLPLLLLCDRPRHIIHAAAGYRIGSIDTALSFCRGWQTESPHRPRAQ